MWLFCAVAGSAEEGEHFFTDVALDEDFAVFGGTARAAFVFEQAGKGVEVVGGADEALDEGDGFAFALFGVGDDAEVLVFGGKGFRLCFAGVFVGKVGIGGVDHVDSLFSVVAHGMNVFSRVAVFLRKAQIYGFLFNFPLIHCFMENRK